MRVNADFSQRIVVRPHNYDWVSSPSAGVDRMMLDRIGDEVARATSIVRFQPNTTFDAHTHGGGEEFLVLDGTFSDEYEDYTAGTYVRNPAGTSHTPSIGARGATIFVKLHQFQTDDTEKVVINTRHAKFQPGVSEGLSVLPLHSFDAEQVAMVRWSAGARLSPQRIDGGEEIYVVEGMFEDELGSYGAGSWIRNPPGSLHAGWSEKGCLTYVKTGHLAGMV